MCLPEPESIVNPVTLSLPELNRLGFHPVDVPTITILIIANVFHVMIVMRWF